MTCKQQKLCINFVYPLYCCKRELSSWPTDKCRLLEYLWTWPVSGYQYSKRLAHTQVLITFTFFIAQSRYFYTYWWLNHTWENMVGNACGFLSSKHPDSIESLKHFFSYITHVSPERLGLSNHSILCKILSV